MFLGPTIPISTSIIPIKKIGNRVVDVNMQDIKVGNACVKIENSQSFEQWLEDFGDPLTQYRFSDYANIGSSISWSQVSKSKLLTSIEWSGILSGLIAPTLGFETNDEGSVLINDVPLINYIRLDATWSKYISLKSQSEDKIAMRLRAGSAWVGEGTEVLPFDRAFYGGDNSGQKEEER